MLESTDSSQNFVTNLFTLSALGVGMLTYLYNRIMSKMTEVEEDVKVVQDGFQDLNENVNTMFLRLEALPKKDLAMEESESIVLEGNKFQAWIGTSNLEDTSLWVCITRSQLNTKKENTEWMEWDGTNDSSVTVRNYYFDTFESDDWKITKDQGLWTANTYETMVEGWTNVIRVYARITFNDSQDHKNMEEYKEALTRMKTGCLVDWRRELTMSP